jgi:F0F1-type ATP synthase membrane subunit a
MENIFTYLRPFTIFAKLLGVFPLSFEGRVRNGNLQMKVPDIIFSIFVFLLVFNLIRLRYLELNFSSETDVPSKLVVYSLLFEFVALFAKLFDQNIKRKGFGKFFELIKEFDKKVKFSFGFLYFMFVSF